MLFPRETARISHSCAVSAPPEELSTVFCVHNDRLFGLGHSTKVLDYESPDWHRVGHISFPANPEQVLVSTPEGLVVFGGRVDGKVISDLHIFNNSAWTRLSHDLRGRANCACCWIPYYDRLLISGGQDDTGVLSDFVLVDLKVGSVQVIDLVTPLAFSRHSVTYITGNTVCLFGGLDADGNINSRMFLISLNNGKVKEITDIPVLAPRHGHWAFNFFGNLLITGGCGEGDRENAAMLFVFRWKVWLSIRVPKNLRNAFPLNRGFLFVSDNGDCSIVRYFKDTKEPFSGGDDPDYIDFLGKLCEVSLQAESLILNSAESRSSELLMHRRILYKTIAGMVENPEVGQLARVYANDIAERDRIKKHLSLVKKQRRRQQKREGDAQQMPKLADREELRKVISERLKAFDATEKMKRKTAIKAKGHEVEELFKKLDSRTTRTRRDDRVCEQEIEQVLEEIKRLQARVDEEEGALAEVVPFASETNFLNLYSELDRLNEEMFNQKVRIRDLRTKYYGHYQTILDLTLEQQTLKQKRKKTESIADAVLGLQIALNKRKDMITTERKLDKEANDAAAALMANIARLKDPPGTDYRETLKMRVEAVSDALEDVVSVHNERVDVIDPGNRLGLKLSEGEKPRLRAQFKDSGSIQTSVWTQLYSVIEEHLIEMGEYYKKHKRNG